MNLLCSNTHQFLQRVALVINLEYYLYVYPILKSVVQMIRVA